MNELINQEFLYRQTPVEYDGTGTIVDIKGNTVKFNQLVQNGNFADTNGWGSVDCSISASNNILTTSNATANDFRIQHNQTFISGHNYYICISAKPLSIDTELAFGQTYVKISTKSFPVNVWTKRAIIINVDRSDNQSFWCFQKSAYQAQDIQFMNIMIHDLTAIFGSGNEPSTPEAFESWLSSHIGNLPYYDYTLGTLIPFNGTGLKTTGKNQVDCNAFVKGRIDNGNVGYASDTSVLTKTDTSLAFTTTASWRGITSDFIRVKAGQHYLIYTPTFTGQMSMNVHGYDLGKNWIERKNSIEAVSGSENSHLLTFAEDCFIRLCILLSTSSSATVNNISFGDNSSFEPYTTSTLSLPISTYFPTGMKDIPNTDVYDEMTSSRADTRVGSGDLGTLNWAMGNVSGRFYSSGIILYVAKYSDIHNQIVCSKYISSNSPNLAGLNNLEVSIDSSGYIQIRDDSYSDATTFKQAMADQNVKLYYELATPTETDISPSLDLTYPIWDNGTEQILPENTSTPTTSPILCDIDYRTMIPVNADDDPDGSGVITGTGNYRYHSMATLTATPTDEIYRFLRWEDENGDTVSTNSTYTFEVGE